MYMAGAPPKKATPRAGSAYASAKGGLLPLYYGTGFSVYKSPQQTLRGLTSLGIINEIAGQLVMSAAIGLANRKSHPKPLTLPLQPNFDCPKER